MTAPVVRTPRDVADLRVWLRDQWAPGGIFARAAAAQMVARSPVGNPNPDAWSRWERTTLERATLWWVGDDMVDLLLASARSIPDDVHITDIPTPAHSGLVVFAKPWSGIDADDPQRTVQVDAIMWGGGMLPPEVRPATAPDGLPVIAMSSYRRLDFDAGLDKGELDVAVSTGAIGNGRTESSGARSFTIHGTAWAPLGRSDWPLADELGVGPYPMTPGQHGSYVEDRRVLAALWTLLHQEGIARTTVEYVTRPERRRTQRAGIDPAVADVRVVTLRRLHRTESAPAAGTPEHVEWSHRWLVAGHWRWQRVGAGRSQRRLTYVRPHVKGPDDKPLIVPQTVRAWVR